MAQELRCEFSACPWVSPRGELATVVKLMEIHFAAKHELDKTAKVNSNVNRFKQNTMLQLEDEPIRRFAGRCHGLPAVSEYAVKCTCCGAVSHNKVHAKPKERKCKFCGEHHILGKKNCGAAGKHCENCGKKDHLSKVCWSRKKAEELPKSEAASQVHLGRGVHVKAGPQHAAGHNWACGALQDEEANQMFNSYQDTNTGFYSADLISQNKLKRGIKNKQKSKISKKSRIDHSSQN